MRLPCVYATLTVHDIYDIPPGYNGGLWKANSVAGTGDTSLWRMSYTGIGNLRLIR